MTFVFPSYAALRADTHCIVSTVVVEQKGLVGGAMIEARLKLREGYGCMPPHAVGAHVHLLKAAITVDTSALLTLHISQTHALFTSLLLPVVVVGMGIRDTCKQGEG